MVKHFRSLLVFVVIFLQMPQSFSQYYSMANLDNTIKENANAIIREDETRFTVTDTAKANYYHHLVVTVMNKNGESFANLYDTYDKYDKITDISGKIYNSSGQIIRKIKQSEFIDQSLVDNYTLFSDSRMKYCIPVVNQYPYTVEYEIYESLTGMLGYPSWFPQHSYDLAVEHSKYTLTLPKKLKVTFKAANFNTPPSQSQINDNISYSFEIKQLKAVEEEPLSLGIQEISPFIHAIAEYFKMDEFSGSNDTWQSFGNWIEKLNQMDNILSEKTKSELEVIKSSTADRKELIKKVYEYIQSKTRYVNLRLGIGGWKPLDASIVDKVGYGDCKALSNYTKTILNQVGIDAYYTVVHAGQQGNDIYTEQTYNQFNHAIVCIPDQHDTIWLECTSQTIPCGFLGEFTDNRHVLMITPDGGKLVKTPYYTGENNSLNRNANFQVDDQGNAIGKMITKYKGLQFDNKEGIVYLPLEKQKEALYNEIGIPSTIKQFTFKEQKDRLPALDEHIDLTLTKYAVVMGNRIMLPLNALNRMSSLSKLSKERKTRFRLRMAYLDSDTLIYCIPDGYAVEYAPEPSGLKTEFGEYTYTVVTSSDKAVITYIRRLKMNDGIFPPEKYADFVTFINRINKMDNLKISLLKS